jgi:glycosyltransferase involved in cell wall biosynthesis
MRVGLIVPGFSASERDWCIPALLDLVRELARDNQVDVFALRYPHRRGAYSVHGATVHALGGATTAGPRRILLLTRALATIVDQHRREPLDVIHGVWADEPGGLAVIAGRLLGVPVLVSLLGGELVALPDVCYGGQLSRTNRWLVRIALRRAAQVTAGSNYLCRLARDHIKRGKLELMPLGVDTRRFHPEAEAGNATPLCGQGIKLLHVGSLVPVKDQTMLLRAFSHAVGEMPSVQLHIVGDGPLRRNLEELTALLGVVERVTFHGAVSHDELPAYYRAADLCVLSSRHESQGMVVLEAAACGRATVGTAVGILPDLVPATRVVPVGDHRALADVLVDVLKSPRTLAEMGRASQNAVASNYTLKQTVTRLNALYHDLLAPGSG